MKHKRKISRLEARRQDYEKMIKNMTETQRKGFTCPGSLKK